jgi:hypothetical protein
MECTLIRKDETQFKGLTGLGVQEFDRLMQTFVPECEQVLEKFTFHGKIRTRRYSPRGGKLKTMEEMLFFMPVYYKNNSSQQFQAAAFGMKQDMCNKWIKFLHPIMLRALKDFAPKKRVQDLPPQQTVLMDATERPIQRPVEDQQEYSGGKKKRHTVKNLVLTSVVGLILWVGAAVCGKMHDKTLADAAHIPAHWHIKADLGFYGMQHTHPNIKLPHKKPRGADLTEEQKRENRALSSERVKVEHAIAGVKTWRIVKDIYRNHDEDIRNEVFIVACALHNLRLSSKTNYS